MKEKNIFTIYMQFSFTVFFGLFLAALPCGLQAQIIQQKPVSSQPTINVKQTVNLHVPLHGARNGGRIHLVAFATNNLGSRLPNLPLVFNFENGSCSATTDVRGRASCAIKAVSDQRNLKVTFAGNNSYSPAERRGVIQASTFIGYLNSEDGLKIELEDVNGVRDQASYVRAVVTRNGQPVPGQLLLFIADGKAMGMDTTNYLGIAHISYKIKPADLNGYLRAGETLNGQLEVSTVSGSPALAFRQISLRDQFNPFCPDPPEPLADRPSFVPITSQKCSVLSNPSTPAIRPVSRIKVFRFKPDEMEIVTPGQASFSLTPPPAPPLNAGCNPNYPLGAGCRTGCVFAEYKLLTPYDNELIVYGRASDDCKAGQPVTYNISLKGYESYINLFRDLCADSVASNYNLSQAWTHNRPMVMPFRFVPIFKYFDAYYFKETSAGHVDRVFQITQDFYYPAFSLNTNVTIECR